MASLGLGNFVFLQLVRFPFAPLRSGSDKQKLSEQKWKVPLQWRRVEEDRLWGGDPPKKSLLVCFSILQFKGAGVG